jgi:hypothetical protein
VLLTGSCTPKLQIKIKNKKEKREKRKD